MMSEVHSDNANFTKCLDTFLLSVCKLLLSFKSMKNIYTFEFLLGLLRLQTQLGDYHQALKAIENVSLDMKTSGMIF